MGKTTDAADTDDAMGACVYTGVIIDTDVGSETTGSEADVCTSVGGGTNIEGGMSVDASCGTTLAWLYTCSCVGVDCATGIVAAILLKIP